MEEYRLANPLAYPCGRSGHDWSRSIVDLQPIAQTWYHSLVTNFGLVRATPNAGTHADVAAKVSGQM